MWAIGTVWRIGLCPPYPKAGNNSVRSARAARAHKFTNGKEYSMLELLSDGRVFFRHELLFCVGARPGRQATG
eukprot:scaffold57877_cov41-Cyclotella_meneghiniana.AAC.1